MDKKRTVRFDLSLTFEYDSEELDALCKQFDLGIGQMHRLIEGGMEEFSKDFDIIKTLENFSEIRENYKKDKVVIEPTSVKKIEKNKETDNNQTQTKKESAKKEDKKAEEVSSQMQKEFEDLDDLDDLD